jgi:hypothetical protein
MKTMIQYITGFLVNNYKCSCVKGYKMESILGKPGKTTCKIDGMHEL